MTCCRGLPTTKGQMGKLPKKQEECSRESDRKEGDMLKAVNAALEVQSEKDWRNIPSGKHRKGMRRSRRCRRHMPYLRFLEGIFLIYLIRLGLESRSTAFGMSSYFWPHSRQHSPRFSNSLPISPLAEPCCHGGLAYISRPPLASPGRCIPARRTTTCWYFHAGLGGGRRTQPLRRSRC